MLAEHAMTSVPDAGFVGPKVFDVTTVNTLPGGPAIWFSKREPSLPKKSYSTKLRNVDIVAGREPEPTLIGSRDLDSIGLGVDCRRELEAVCDRQIDGSRDPAAAPPIPVVKVIRASVKPIWSRVESSPKTVGLTPARAVWMVKIRPTGSL